ncbi:mechanosensitive ion channel family protein [Blastococcus atacamensis]|uniref:mechanosensitive ion channel family protein n=1 Tax=Blastococcus atacamensis TaxID=2070508 RepID=UPI001E574646|nr:mechanosensitive ion channel domain-containing protein [Blastococcus atacamensis]
MSDTARPPVNLAVADVEVAMPAETWQVLLVLAGAVAVAWLVGLLIGAVTGRLARRSPVLAGLSRRGRTPLRLLLVTAAVITVLQAATEVGEWRGPVVHALALGLIAAIGWLVAAVVYVAADLTRARYDVDVVDNRHARRVRTQISLLRRLGVVLVGVLTVAAMLLTFPAARAAGAGILASAGVISIVAGLAAQTSLANVFAGLQLAFTDAIRVDDVVVVEEEWGRIEEITLTYVVVHVWDDRRLILPSTYFTTTPFANWTRTASALLGTVELDVDWNVPVEQVRGELARLLAGSQLWDGRTGVLQVTDAVGSVVRLRALVSAGDAGSLWDLRCEVREGLVRWLRQQATALPRVRLERAVPVPAPEPAGAPGPADEPAGVPESAENTTVFSGSAEGKERSQTFAGPGGHEEADRHRSGDAPH